VNQATLNGVTDYVMPILNKKLAGSDDGVTALPVFPHCQQVPLVLRVQFHEIPFIQNQCIHPGFATEARYQIDS
jgi:hypothetical protein